jgi:peptidoglycan/LPS O-acetylase OafA/YrhL
MQMYLVLPGLFLLVTRWTSMKPVFGLWIAAVAFAILQSLTPRTGRLDIFQFAPCFVAGILSYKLSKSVKPRLPFLLWPLLLACFAGLCLLAPGRHNRPLGWSTCILAAITLPFVRETTSAVLQKTFHWIAQHSYGIYVIHYFCLWFAFRANRMNIALQWILFALTIVLLPMALYRLVEAPMIRIGRKLSGIPRQMPEPEALVAGS